MHDGQLTFLLTRGRNIVIPYLSFQLHRLPSVRAMVALMTLAFSAYMCSRTRADGLKRVETSRLLASGEKLVLAMRQRC